jgi:diguanylate cyclase (GGDEF)-like protein/PAS domain S-box-containing protein
VTRKLPWEAFQVIIFTPYALPSSASAVVILFLLIYIIIYRRNNDAAWLVIPLMIGFFIWSFGYAMMLLHTELDQKVFWFNLSQLGPDFSPILWFLLTLEHTGYRNPFQKKWLYPVLVFPVFTTLLMWTNDWHHLLRRSVALYTIGNNTTSLAIECGPWFFVETVYGYFFFLLSMYLLARFLEMSSSKKQTLIFFCSILIPLLFNILDIFKINPLKPYGASSIAFSITGIFLAWGVFRHRFLDITPIARNVVLEKIGDGVIVLDRQHRIVDANPAAYPLFRIECISPSQVIGTAIEDLISLWPEWNEPFEMVNADRIQMELKVKDEHRFYNVTSSLIAKHRQGPVGWVIIFNDITEVKQTNQRLQYQLDEIQRLQEQLREQAIRDELTGCYNRHYLNEMLVRESSRAHREKKTIGLMMLDIDHFKKINDTYGHLCGDQILQTIGRNLQQWMRVEDTVCRYGGEEFLAVLPGISLEAIHERARSLCSQIDELQFVVTPEVTLHVTVSIGMALYPVHNDDIQQALNCADQALYSAKHAGRNTVVLWNANTDELA